MATFFGEVLSVYSRAVEEDEDEEDNEEDLRIRSEVEQKRVVSVEWCSDIQSELPCSELILTVGPNAVAFLSAYVLCGGDWQTVGSVSLWNERNRSQAEAGCVFYRQKDCSSVLICQCTCYIAEDQQFQWVEKVFACLQKRGLSVTVLADCSVCEFKTSCPLFNMTPFLRALKTSTYSGQLSCPLLEQPNIVSGLPAAVINHCQVHRIPAVLYQCYTDVISADSVSMETYKSALSCLGKLIKLNPCPSADIFKKVIRISEVQSNMYI